MNKIKPKYDISVWLLLTAAVFIVVFFLWYFFIYVSGQEKLQVQKDFRALTQIGDNFKSRYESYISIIKSEYLQKIPLNTRFDEIVTVLEGYDKWLLLNSRL